MSDFFFYGIKHLNSSRTNPRTKIAVPAALNPKIKKRAIHKVKPHEEKYQPSYTNCKETKPNLLTTICKVRNKDSVLVYIHLNITLS